MHTRRSRHAALQRPRVRELLRPADGGAPGLVLLLAPTGYGKTTAAAEAFGTPGRPETACAWVRCARGGENAEHAFWSDAVAAVEESSGSDLDAPADAPPIVKIRRWAAGLDAPFALVVDDYDLVGSPDLDRDIVGLAEAAPNLALVVLARRVHLLDSPLLAGRVPISVVRGRELAFTVREAGELLAAEPDAGRRERIRELSAGWPLALSAALSEDAGEAVEPVRARLGRMTLDLLSLVGEDTGRLALLTALLGVMDADLAVAGAGLTREDAAEQLAQLSALGLLVTAPGSADHASDASYACHPAVRDALSHRALRAVPLADRDRLLGARAAQLEQSDPCAAFALLCEAHSYPEAEVVLAKHFTAVTDRAEQYGPLLRAAPEHVLALHPTFAAARIAVESPDPTVPRETLRRLAHLMRAGASRRLSEGAEEDPADLPTDAGPGAATRLDAGLGLAAAAQMMTAERILGDSETAHVLATRLEARLGLSAATLGAGTELAFTAEIAATALASGDTALARRNWARLLSNVDAAAEDRRAGWRLAGLSGLAVTDVIDGDIAGAETSLAEIGTIREASPALYWVSGEIARAAVAVERHDPRTARRVLDRIEPWRDRIGLWQLPLMIDADILRTTRGTDWALPQLTAGIDLARANSVGTGVWEAHLSLTRAMLLTLVGDFADSEQLLAGLPRDCPRVTAERARLALFRSDGVQGLLAAQSIGAAGLSRGQLIDRHLLAAASAWICEARDEAFTALQAADEHLSAYGLSTPLWNVPHDVLIELAAAAREAGVCDLTAEIEAVPERARCTRYERLSGMELRTLEAIAVHNRVSHAADALFVAPATVKVHLRSIYRKLRVGSREQAILRATRMGVLRLAPGTDPARPIDETFPSESVGRSGRTVSERSAGDRTGSPRAG